MQFNSGFGKSKRKNSLSAGKEACQQAVDALGRKPEMLIVYATANYDQLALLQGIAEANTAGCPVVGCSGEGLIDNEESYEGNNVVGVLALASDLVKFTPFFYKDVVSDGLGAGRNIAKEIMSLNIKDPKGVMLYPDGLRSNCTQILKGLNEVLPSGLEILGGTSGDSLQFEQSFQYFGTGVMSGGLSGFVISGPVKIDYIVSHGCSPIGNPVEVTKANGNVLIELNNKPAADALQEYFDIDSSKENIVQGGIGESAEEIASEYDSPYIMRAPMGINADRSINLAVEIPVHSKIHYHRREPQEIALRSKRAFTRMLARHPDEKPLFVMQFDCAGRGKTLFNNDTTTHIVTPLISCLPDSSIPWSGFHSFGEIAPVKKKAIYHNYTVVLCVFYHDKKAA